MDELKLVFDSSSIISMSQSCLINVLRALQQSLSAEFIVSKNVVEEIAEKPMRIKRFELNAVRVKKAIDDGWLKSIEMNHELEEKTNEIMGIANNCFFSRGKPIRLIHGGEAESLALMKAINGDALVIDERTARMMIENPARMKAAIQQRLGKPIAMDKKNAFALQSAFKGMNIVRSVELVALAFERKLLGKELIQGKKALEAALYAVKFAGCAISFKEIETYLGEVNG